MYYIICSLFNNIKYYISYFMHGDKHENELRIIYKRNYIDIKKIYNKLYKINKYMVKEPNYNKILKYLNIELRYEEDLKKYNSILNIELNTPEKIKSIELYTNLKCLKIYFEKIIYIRSEYYNNYYKIKGNIQ